MFKWLANVCCRDGNDTRVNVLFFKTAYVSVRETRLTITVRAS